MLLFEPLRGALLLCQLQRLPQRVGALLVGLYDHTAALELCPQPFDLGRVLLPLLQRRAWM